MTLEEKYKHEMYLAKRDGKAEGKTEGRAEGRAEGAAEEKNRINTLILRLAENGRSDELVKAASDPEYQLRLLEEFGL